MILQLNLPIESFLDVVRLKLENSITSAETYVEMQTFRVLDGVQRDLKLFHINHTLWDCQIMLIVGLVILHLAVFQDDVPRLPAFEHRRRLLLQPASYLLRVSCFLASLPNLVCHWLLWADFGIVLKEFIDHLLMFNNLL